MERPGFGWLHRRSQRQGDADRQEVLDILDSLDEVYVGHEAARSTAPELDALAQSAAQLSGADRGLVTRVVDDGSLQFVGTFERTRDGRTEGEALEAMSCCRQVVLRNAELELVREPADAAEMWDPPVSFFGTPIRSGDESVLGAVCVVARTPRTWSTSDRVDVASVAGLAAPAMSQIFGE